MTTKFCFLGGGCRWTQAASGEAGQANAGLCPASSLLSVLILIVFVRNASSITVCNCRLWFRRSSWESFSFARCSHCYFSLASLVGCKAVGVFVCPSACVSQKSHFWTLRELLFMLPTTVTRFCSENSAILLCASGFITGCLSPVIPALPGLEVGQYAIPALSWTGKNHTVTSFPRSTIPVCVSGLNMSWFSGKS